MSLDDDCDKPCPEKIRDLLADGDELEAEEDLEALLDDLGD